MDLFESAFKYSSIGIALVSPAGKWLKVNQALLSLLGYSEAEFLALDFIQMTHPEDLKKDLDLVQETLVGLRESYQLEKRYFHKNGSIVYALLSVSLIRNEDKTPQFFISQIQDITELKKTQQNLQTNTKLAALGELAAGIAHEINNPLTIIGLHARALEDLIHEEEINKELLSNFTVKIGETIRRINSIITSLKKFSSGIKRSEGFENCCLVGIIKDALNLCQEKFKLHGIQVSLDMPDDLEVECHPSDISQIIINLINNAYYAVKDQAEKVITLSARIDGEFVEIVVMDSGPGVPQEIRSRLMDPFFTTKPNGQGTGLGLSISSSIAKFHKGELYLDDQSEDTRFVVRLPLKQPYSNKLSRSIEYGL